MCLIVTRMEMYLHVFSRYIALFMDAHQIVGEIGFEMSGHIDDVTFVEFSVFNVALFLLHMMFVHLFYRCAL